MATEDSLDTAAATSGSQICDACGKPGENLLCCARCKQAWYHDKTCQLNHYPDHKAKCRQLVAAAEKPAIATVDSSSDEKTIADGIQVIKNEEVGRACIATKDFKPGDTVLLELPAIVFDERAGYAGLFDAYLDASKDTQEKIMKMYRPPTAKIEENLDEKRKKIRVKRKQLLVSQYNQYVEDDPDRKTLLPFELAEQLIAVVDANAHAFQAQHTIDMVATPTNAVPRTYHALFTLGSRVEHSCSPNMTFITIGGKLEYFAEMNIKSGDRLSISYLGSVYERPRKQRQAFLKENKVFLCKCARCMGYDECSPMFCECDGGIMFHSGSRNQWECQSCGKQASKASSDEFIANQLQGEAELLAQIRRYQYILQTQPYPEMLEEILEVVKTVQWKEVIHPLHWLNVEVFKLVSSVAASAARMYVKDQGVPVTSEEVISLLHISSMAMIRRTIWMERNVAIVRDLLPLGYAVKCNEDYEAFLHEKVGPEAVEAVINDLCDPEKQFLKDLGTLGMSSAFHAGQDLILAGQKDLALKIYKRYEISFSRWEGLSDDSRAKIKAFIDSEGEDNQFGNFLML